MFIFYQDVTTILLCRWISYKRGNVINHLCLQIVQLYLRHALDRAIRCLEFRLLSLLDQRVILGDLNLEAANLVVGVVEFHLLSAHSIPAESLRARPSLEPVNRDVRSTIAIHRDACWIHIHHGGCYYV